jgi:hypothetical protein
MKAVNNYIIITPIKEVDGKTYIVIKQNDVVIVE